MQIVDWSTFTDAYAITLTNTALAYVFQDGLISISSRVEIEQNKHIGPVSAILRMLTIKDGDLTTIWAKMAKHKDLLLTHHYNKYILPITLNLIPKYKEKDTYL